MGFSSFFLSFTGKKKVNYNKKRKGNEKKKTNGFPIRHREQRTLTPPVADNK
jgi:hypothetical protein